MGKIWTVIIAAAMIGVVYAVLARLRRRGPKGYDGLVCVMLPFISGMLIGGFIGEYIGQRVGFIIGGLAGLAGSWYACRTHDKNLKDWKEAR